MVAQYLHKPMIRIGGGIILLVCAWIPFAQPKLNAMLFIAAYLWLGWDVILQAVRSVRWGAPCNENVLMSLATIGALCIEEWFEAVVVMLLYQIGEFFQNYAVEKSRASISDLMAIRPEYANVRRKNAWVQVSPEEVRVGEQIGVKPGERIPLDGVIVEGLSTLDTSALTGETRPRQVHLGDTALSGCVNLNGFLVIQVSKPAEESTVSKILELVENAAEKKSRSERFISKFARYYTPVVVCLAVLLATVPTIIFGFSQFSLWLYRALSFLVVSCPCALILSVPLSFFGGIGGGARQGILMKGSNCLEALAKTEIIAFDKTGTLTKGVFQVQEVCPEYTDVQTLLRLAAYSEYYSSHPLALPLKAAFEGEIEEKYIDNVEEIAGQGIKARIDDKLVLVGNRKLLASAGIYCPQADASGTIVYVAEQGRYLGYIVVADQIKEEAVECLQELCHLGIRQTVILTGDGEEAASSLAQKLHINRYYDSLLPGDKVAKVAELMQEKSSSGKVVFVGDGINDAPVLAGADVGVAMGVLGADAAIEAADIVIMDDKLTKLPTAIRIARKTLRIAKENIVFSLAIKILVLFLCAFGMAGMGAAIFADVGVCILAVLNSFRALFHNISSV